MWDALAEICERTQRSIHDICDEVRRGSDGENFTSLLRVYILAWFRNPGGGAE